MKKKELYFLLLYYLFIYLKIEKPTSGEQNSYNKLIKQKPKNIIIIIVVEVLIWFFYFLVYKILPLESNDSMIRVIGEYNKTIFVSFHVQQPFDTFLDF